MAKERELKWVKEAQEEMEEEVKETAEAEETEAAEETSESEENTADEAAEEVLEEPAEEADGKLQEAVERYQRLFAEFDNFRKRTDKEKAARYDMGAKDVIEKILPLLDNFELTLKNVPDDKEASAFAEGIEMIHKQFVKVLEDLGVTAIEAVGKEFDPAFHNAVMHVDDEEAGDNIVVEEFQKGYMYKEHVVRYSMVKVAN